jgi:hypothetical protein
VAGQIETRNRGMQNIRGHPEPVEVFELLGRVGPGSGGEDESPANTAGEG